MKFKKNIRQILEHYWPIDVEFEEKAAEEVLQNLRAEMQKHDLSLRTLKGDGWTVPAVSQHEFEVLTAVDMFNGKGNSRSFEMCLKHSVSNLDFAKIFVILDELLERGLVSTNMHPKSLRELFDSPYALTPEGQRVLTRAQLEGKAILVRYEAAADSASL